MAVPAAVSEGTGVRESLRRGFTLGRADYVHAAGSLAGQLRYVRERWSALLGDKLAARIPMKLVHGIAAAIFAILGLATLLGAGERFGF